MAIAPAMEHDVARKTAKAEEPKDPREDWERKPLSLQIRGSEEWKAALTRVAEFDGLPVAVMVDRAIRQYARGIGFPGELPPR
jgi:hypothetical protein